MIKRLLALILTLTMTLGTVLPCMAAEETLTSNDTNGTEVSALLPDSFTDEDAELTGGSADEEADTRDMPADEVISLSDDLSEGSLSADEAADDAEPVITDEDVSGNMIAEGDTKVYDRFVLDWPDYDIDRDQFKLCYLSSEDTNKLSVWVLDGENIEDIGYTNLLAAAFGVAESSVSQESIKYELLKKSGNDYVPADDAESPVTIARSTDPTDLRLFITRKAERSDVQCYLRVTVNFPNNLKNNKTQITLPLTNAPTEYYDTKEAASAAVRDIIRNRVNNSAAYYDARNYRDYDKDGYVYERIFIKEDLFPGSINMEELCDFDEERDGMRPDEGDYMLNLIRNRKKRKFYYEHPSTSGEGGKTLGFTYKDGISYRIYEIYLPVITTRSEEEAVDNKIKSLLNNEFKSVKSGSNKEKINAVYNYVKNHVKGEVSGSGGSDRTYPLYHTAYHALIKGNGTCESYANLFTRLTRELGVPSKVIMGTDSAAHAYNIVDGGDGYWYFIDCSTGRYLTDGPSFKRAAEQERYTTPRYYLNYWNKIKGGVKHSVKTIKILKNNDIICEATSLEDVCSYIDTASDEDPSAEWIVRFDSDWKTEMNGLSFKNPGRVSINLNGHTLTCKNECAFAAKKVYNGTIKAGYKGRGIGYSGNAYFSDYASSSIEISNVKFVGATGKDGVKFDAAGTKDILLDNVAFKNVFVSVAQYERNVAPEYCPDYSFKLNNTVTLDNSYFYIQNIKDNDHPIIFSKTYDGGGNLLYKGKLVLKGTVTFGEKLFDDKTVQTPIEFAVSGPGTFVSGDVVLTNSGTVKRVTNTSGKVSKAGLSSVIDLNATKANIPASDPTLTLMEMDKSLIFAKPTFALYAGEMIDANLIGNYLKWSETVAAINKRKNSKASYTVALLADTNGLEGFTFPKKAKALTIIGNGYVFSHKGNLKLTCPLTLNDLTLIPSGSKSVLDLNGKTLTLTDVTMGGDKNSYKSVKGSGASCLYLTSTLAKGSNIDLKKKVNVTSLYVADEYKAGESCTGSYHFADLKVKNLAFDISSSLIAGKLKATNVYQSGNSALKIDTSADIKNLYLGQYPEGKGSRSNISGVYKDVTLIRSADTSVRIRSAVKSNSEGSVLSVYTVDAEVNPIGTDGSTVLFTTDMKVFPEDLIKVVQPASHAEYDKLVRINKQIVVARDWFDLSCEDPVTGVYEPINSFAKWSDVISHIESLNDRNGKYKISLKESVNIRDALSFPKKAASLIITSNESGTEVYTLTFNGNIAPAVNTTLNSINLLSTSKKTKLNLGNRQLSMIDSSIHTVNGPLSSVSGKDSSSLDLLGSTDPIAFDVRKNITVGSLKAENANITSSAGSLKVSKLLTMSSASVDTAVSITLKNVGSLNNENSISYASTKKGTFKITGSMQAGDELVKATPDTGTEGEVSKYAVSITPKYMKGNYSGKANLKKTLVTAPKVPASCFVVNRQTINPDGSFKVAALTVKVKKTIRLATH